MSTIMFANFSPSFLNQFHQVCVFFFSLNVLGRIQLDTDNITQSRTAPLSCAGQDALLRRDPSVENPTPINERLIFEILPAKCCDRNNIKFIY